jgi:hypothetical protein
VTIAAAESKDIELKPPMALWNELDFKDYSVIKSLDIYIKSGGATSFANFNHK